MIWHRDTEKNENESSSLKKKAKTEVKVPYARLLGVGMQAIGQFCILIFVGYYIGAQLDQRWHTAPWLMILSTAIFMVAGVYQLIRYLKFLDRD